MNTNQSTLPQRNKVWHRLGRYLCALLLCCLCACSPRTTPISPGVVPGQKELQADDEAFGHDVLSMLSRDYKLDRDDARINRVRAVVDKLTAAPKFSGNPWHVYVFDDPHTKNASATRGNYIFVWSGILSSVKDDDELAAILAHEVAHVLAGHTKPTPAEEVNSMIAGVAGGVAGQILAAKGLGPVADLAEYITRETINAIIVNPEEQRKEFEADQIGLFLMADSDINPEKAITFWERALNDPDFSGSYIQAFSSHPATEARLTRLKEILPQAKLRYDKVDSFTVHETHSPGTSSGKKDKASDWTIPNDKSSAATTQEENDFVLNPEKDSFTINQTRAPLPSKQERDLGITASDGTQSVWTVVATKINVFASADFNSPIIGQLVKGTDVVCNSAEPIRNRQGYWLEISNPVSGYVRSKDLVPSK